MTDNLFDNAKFGDMYLTSENKQAVFLRLTENAEYKFAILYVEGWGLVQVFRHNGKEIHNDVAHSIVCKSKEPVSEDLEEAAKNHAVERYRATRDMVLAEKCKWSFQTGAEWKEKQMMSKAVDGVVHHFEKCKVASVHYNDPTGVPMAYFTSPEGLSAGDKVKIIVIKED